MTGWQAVFERCARRECRTCSLAGDPGHLYDAVYELEQMAARKRSGPLRDLWRVPGNGIYPRYRDLAACVGAQTGRGQSGAGCTGSLFRLHADAGARSPRQPPDQWHGRIPGNRPSRHYAADHQMGHHRRDCRAHPLDIRRAVQLPRPANPARSMSSSRPMSVGTFDIPRYHKGLPGIRPGADEEDLARRPI